MGAHFQFDEGQFNKLFPFFVLIDNNLNIKSYGKTIGKLCCLAPGDSFNKLFQIKRPAFHQYSWEGFLKLQNQLVILECQGSSRTLFRGQIEVLSADNSILFIGSPWFESMDAVHQRGLSLHDFALHDPLVDLLYVLKTQEMVSEDIKKLLETVNNQRSELKHLSLFAEQTTSAIIITNHESRIEWVNKAFEKITGYTLGEIKGRKPGQFLHGEDTDPATVQYVRTQVQRGESFECEILNYHKSGAPYWVKLKGQPMRDQFGKICQYFALHEDITQQKSVELEFDQQRQFYENIINNLPANIAVFSADQRFLFLNPSSIRDTELRRWLIGKSEEDYATYRNISPERALYRRQKFREAVENKQLVMWEEAIERPGQPTLYFLRHLYPVFDEQAEVNVVIGYGIDITELKNTQHELEIAKYKTEAMAETRQKFLATVSHEIRTPMNGILGISSLFGKTSMDAQQREMLRIIQESAQNLMAIANDILDLEKINTGHLALESIAFNLADKVRTVTDTFKYKAFEKKIRLTLLNRIPSDCTVKGDPFRLSQILSNLIENAIKFTEKGSVTIEGDCTVSDSGNLTAIFRVQDTGIGISQDRLSEVFNPFIQANVSISRKYGGTGLGLSICKELVDKMGGRISLYSEEGKGSMFEVAIPYEQAVLQEMVTMQQSDIDLTLLKGIRVLVAEDIDINQFLIRHLLKSWGCHFKLVDDGKKVLAALQEAAYDLVLMDIQMPEMDGFEACKIIRASADLRIANIPVIAVTAYALHGDEDRYRDAGMNDRLTKPFTELDLYLTILKVLQRPSSTSDRTSDISATTIDLKPFNLDHLTSLSKGDDTFVHHMVQLFKQTAPAMQQQLRLAAKDEDWETVAAVAHKMKPAIDSMGIVSLKQVIREVESCLQRPIDRDQLMQQIVLINTTLDTCLAQLPDSFQQ